MKSPESSIDARVTAIHALDNRIAEWWSKLPTTLRLSPSDVPGLPYDVLPKLLLIHAVHHQCLCALHSSIVPLFSWSAGDDSWLSARQLSAQIALEHAREASALFEAVLTHLPRLSAIPSFVAYAAYCGCAIQIPFMWCSEPAVRERAHANVRINVRIIHILAKYWKFTSLLVGNFAKFEWKDLLGREGYKADIVEQEIYVRFLYKMHSKNPTPLENEPKYIDPVKLTRFKFNATNVWKTILGFNRILWANDGGYAKQGEEVTDLGVQEEIDSQSTDQGKL